ncbi:MAG: class I mannose-6-phosphate isomerase [Bacteroidetes bacterium]|nr:class I mannose-6-phosphate isomerase [Bacteroidota bacterium]
MKFKYPSHNNYDKFPFIKVKGFDDNSCCVGWENISTHLKHEFENLHQEKLIVVAECYTGIHDEVFTYFTENIKSDYVFHSLSSFKTKLEIDQLVFPDITDDEIFGQISRLELSDFLDAGKLSVLKEEINNISKGIILIYGTAASLLADADVFIYLDMPRWEGQLRFRRNEVANLGADNKSERASLQYKRAYFVDWRVCDKQKIKTLQQWDFVIDTVDSKTPKMIYGEAYRLGLQQAVVRPFRVVPFFDPGPWGGQWMKSVCDLDKEVDNYAWCFDCVPEENSLLLKFGDVLFETPSVNLVFSHAEALLGKAVYNKFGAEFPIRFDFLDTMEGGNLSLQVHPLTEYIRKNFRMAYTQDESYYMLDAGEDACVYLGLKEDIQPRQMLDDLRLSLSTTEFDAEKYVEKWKARKHDHFLIPAGTVHCSGANSMVLEISATPYIFTFKLWDWNRLGLDGRPRPINIDHGEKVIQWNRKTAWTKANLVNQITLIAEGDGWKEEKTGLHELEFIECRRHWFTKKVIHQNPHGVNVLNLVEGAEVIIESPENEFDAFIVHYAETFIVPATIKEYSIRPFGKAEGKLCATIKAYIR